MTRPARKLRDCQRCEPSLSGAIFHAHVAGSGPHLRLFAWAAVALVCLVACGHGAAHHAESHLAPSREDTTAMAERAAKPSPHSENESDGVGDNRSDQSLVGTVLRTSDGMRMEFDNFAQELTTASVVLLGEKHDNPEHHLLQARIYRALLASGLAPGLVFEMLDANMQGEVDAWRASADATPQALAQAVGWQDSGWPPFALYEPIFAAVLAGDGPVVAAGLPRQSAMPIAQGESLPSVGAFSSDLAQRYALDQALPKGQQDALRVEMQEAHCGLLPEEMLDGMVRVQRVRNALLAEGLRLVVQGNPARRAVLIAGAGHVRKDRGVPQLLTHVGIERVIAVGLQEVRDDAQSPGDYLQEAQLEFDYIVLTAATPEVDHCAELRKHFQHRSHK